MADAAFQLEREPPETETSDWMKLVEASERVKVMVAVSPTPRISSASSSVRAMVGAVVSITRALLPASESLLARAGRLRAALLYTASLTVPPLRSSDVVAL